MSTLTSTFKLFLRDLQEPLITTKIKDSILASTQGIVVTDSAKEEMILKIKEGLKMLPALNYNVLRYILHHLKRVVENKENRMNAQSIAVIFGQNFTPNKQVGGRDMKEMMIETERVNKLVEFALTHVHEIFDD